MLKANDRVTVTLNDTVLVMERVEMKLLVDKDSGERKVMFQAKPSFLGKRQDGRTKSEQVRDSEGEKAFLSLALTQVFPADEGLFDESTLAALEEKYEREQAAYEAYKAKQEASNAS